MKSWIQFSNSILWKKGLFWVSYLATLLTPIVIGIIQNVYYDSVLSIFLFGCDILFLIDLYLLWIQRKERGHSSSASSSSIRGKEYISLRGTFIRALSSSCIIILPVGSAFGLCGMDIAWFSLLRMVRHIYSASSNISLFV